MGFPQKGIKPTNNNAWNWSQISAVYSVTPSSFFEIEDGFFVFF